MKAAILTPPGDRSSRTPSCSLGTKGEPPQKMTRGTLTRGWDGIISGSAGTRGALGLPLGRGGARRPLTAQCAEPEEWGDPWAEARRPGLEGTDLGAGKGGHVLPPRRAPGQLRLSPALPSAGNQMFGSRRGAAAGPGRRVAVTAFARSGPRGLRVPGHRYRPRGGVCNSLESCTELGSAQPLVAGAWRKRSTAAEGAGRGQGSQGPAP